MLEPRAKPPLSLVAISWLIGGCVMIVVFILGLNLYKEVRRPPPFEFSAEKYVAERAQVCPGDTLKWKSALTVREAPTVLVVARVIWDVSLQRAWKPANKVDLFVWLNPDEGKPISRAGAFSIPADLPLGTYELRVGATGFNTGAGGYAVPFNVPANCPGGSS